MEITKISDSKLNSTVFNDPVHGHIDLHPLCVKIIDTPEFQRLRLLKQLGPCFFVFPSATHSRFEHSLGVCHLAGKLVRSIRKRQPELNINNDDILCVEIAGLCHDLGHGPFSHLFDCNIIPVLNGGTTWKHEHASSMMFEYILKKHKLRSLFHEFGLTDLDIRFIQEQLTNTKKFNTDCLQAWPYTGRSWDKSFLYEVVANSRNGFDVDKWDYLARDSYMLGLHHNFDYKRCLKFARVLNVDGLREICNRDKEVRNMYEMFYSRDRLHKRAYQHKTKIVIDIMITEAFLKANNYITFKGENGQELRMSETIGDMAAYSQLTDNVFFTILYSTLPELVESREILQNILSRKLYKCVGQIHVQYDKDLTAISIQDGIMANVTLEQAKHIKADDIVIKIVHHSYGMKNKNPIDSMRFYSKEDPDKPVQFTQTEESNVLPICFAENRVLVICKLAHMVNVVREAFYKWCLEKDLPCPKNNIEQTPL